MKRTRSNTKEMLSQGFKFPTAGVQGQNSSETLREFGDFPLIVRGSHIEQTVI